MNIDLNRRQLIGITLAGLATATLAACAGPGGGAGAGRLGLAWYGGDAVHEAMKKLITEYAKKDSSISISEQYAAFADYWDKLATQTAGRTAPDVVRMSMSYFSDYANRGALLDISKYIDSDINISDMPRDVAESGNLDGKYFGVSQSSIANAAFVDPELIGSLGGSVPTDDWTWESFADWAKAIGASGAGKVYGSMDQGGNFQLFESFARDHGTELFTANGSALAVDVDVIEDWWSYWADMRTDRGAPPASISAETTGFDTWPLAKGITAVGFGWVQQIAFLQPVMTRQLEVLMPPTVSGEAKGLFVKCLDFWSISSNAKDPAAAADLIDFLINDDVAIQTLGVVLGVPPTQRAIDLLALDPTSPAGKAAGYIERVRDLAGPAPAAWPTGYNELLSLFARQAQDISFDKSTPAKAAQDFQEQSVQILS
ncbi:extracellular solute-binding protein [Cryobacterium lactosi]|uniref:Extracellular solute-binding protein n=1 Tax=Cryobacterium lactosi TaxID=1259202 RepID=A0A4R9BZE3_9MICO|nr:extracellular solute-binding protein [Cryobacterium lactosi]TFD94122.1 extracellular solute-binding protein [Cryobacterium lactosi]